MANSMTLITGANGGIGQFITRYLLKKGHRNIVCHYRTKHDQLLSLLKEFDLDPDKHTVQADLTDEESVATMANSIKELHGGIGQLVNVAGSSTNAMSWKMSKQEFIKVIEDSLLTSFLCSKIFIPDMRENKYGRIVNFSSIVGFTGMAGAAHYSAAKSGLLGFTKSLALELAPKGITVNAIALGYFNAGLLESVPGEMQLDLKKRIPMGRFGEEDDIGSAVEYLISPESKFMTGQILHLNGGQY